MATSNGWPTSYLTGVASTNDDLHPAHDYVESVTKIPSSAFEKDLIAILLVAEGASEKNKLLFKYEDQTDDKEKGTLHLIIHMEFDPPNISDTDSARRTFRSFQSDTIAALTDPGYNFYGSNFEVQVDDVYFVGHTLAAPDVEKENHLKSFGVYFALRAITKPSVLLSYQTLSKCIGTAIRWEEQRVKYLTQEYNAMSACLQPTLHEHQGNK
ncbi:unnamed protein product [Didymodactylos carnosus]|uniref:Uncharacterized protein n=1 Tax=Didymodactylos carnosus TaxID=1234261 RepID=A0A813PLA2_9BILA|nr:unnamed protein product [Didymodactylos carnosus]CAF1173510.1 unnamed protein product [Didymodactylos carnosus]CAF3532315.1 unnamed protein product [Didymodactylos carnosus]CAF3984764.1 unnamed protein product [Didymodactylos carnosus]